MRISLAAAVAVVVVMIKRFLERIHQKMARHPYISTALTVLAFNFISRFAKSGQFASHQQYSSQPYPTSFFSLQSPVIDYPYGNIADVGKILLEEETLFVMYYAPWCARSIELKHEFEKAAKFLENEVLFVAINCWHRLSSCRQHHVFMSFPVFYFYILGQEGFRYQGVMRSDFMVEFILRMLHPLKYIDSPEKLAEFMSAHDTSVVGYFNMTSPLLQRFNQFYSAALHTYEKDPKNVIPFGVLTNTQLAEQLKISDLPSVALVRSLNDSLKFPSDQNFTALTLSTWALAARQQPIVKWIHPSGLKSLALSSDFRQGPAIVLFLPARPLSGSNRYLALLRQIGLTYNNCNQSSVVSGMVTTDAYHLARNFLQQQLTENQCRGTTYVDTWSAITKKTVPLKSCCLTLKDSACQYCSHYDNSHLSSVKGCPTISLPPFVAFLPPVCLETTVNYNPGEFVSFCCDYTLRDRQTRDSSPVLKRVTTSSTSVQEDGSLDDLFVQDYPRRPLEAQCRTLQKLKSFGWFSSSSDFDLHLLGHNSYSEDFVGLACGTNQTVRFFAMDSASGDVFLENLGLDFRLQTDQLTMILYHAKNELINVMKTKFHPLNIVNFIQNFTVGSLPTFRRSAPVELSRVDLCGDQKRVCILEVTSKTFKKIVLNSSKDVLLLYYTPWCGFCKGFSHVYLALAHQFRQVSSIVFARINCDANDLPWHYMATEYPTLILYPAHSKSDSVMFPMHQAKTLPNLVKFVLQWSSNLLNLDFGLTVCTRGCFASNKNISAVRIDTLFHDIESISLEMSSVLNHRHLLELEIAEAENSDADSSHLELLKNKLKHTETLERLLSQRLNDMRLKLDGAQYLHGVLQLASEPHLNRDTLLSAARRNAMYRGRLKNYEVL